MIKPSKTIGVNYLERWHILPRNRFFNSYLHKFSGSDDDRALHDHPWPSVSILLKGRLMEIRAGNKPRHPIRYIPVFRRPKSAHRLVLMNGETAWTLFLTGPRVREWGFHCPQGWKHWSLMTDTKGNKIGGCE
jgi:hypothetical protein